MGQGNVTIEKRSNRISNVRGTLQQLNEIQTMILEAGPLGSEQIQQDIVDRSVFIADVPYLTDDRVQLEAEWESYFQRVIGRKLQSLTCGIQGDLTMVLAVFQTAEGKCIIVIRNLNKNKLR